MVEANYARARAGRLGQLSTDQIASLDQLVYSPIFDGAVAVANNSFATRNRTLDSREVCLGVCHVSVSSDSRYWSCGVALVEVPGEAAAELPVEQAELGAVSQILALRRGHHPHRVRAR